jgi:hypothetical protein
MNDFKQTLFPDYNKKKTHLTVNQWFLRNAFLLPLRMIWVGILGFITVLCTLAAILILIIIIVYFVLGFYLIINDFLQNYDIVQTGSNLLFFMFVTISLISCLLPSPTLLYLTYLMSRGVEDVQ